MEQSENIRRPVTTTLSMPIACRVCDAVFFDNVSLVYHFESHLDDESTNPSQTGRTMAALQSSWNLTSNFHGFSSSAAEKKNEACHVEFPRSDNYSKSCSFPVSSAKLADGLHFDLVSVPVLNSMPPLRRSLDPSLDPNRDLSQPNVCHSMSLKPVTPSSSRLLVYPQVGAKRSVDGFRKVHPLRFRGQNGARGRNAGYERALIDQLEKPYPDIIVISDNEEEEKNPAEEIDLTLKL